MALTPHRHTFTTTTSVLVGTGEAQRTFIVHNLIITERSAFFSAALAERWSTPDKTVQLPEEAPGIFDLYLACVYQERTSMPNGPLKVLRMNQKSRLAATAGEDPHPCRQDGRLHLPRT